jgi:hypothetical protein
LAVAAAGIALAAATISVLALVGAQLPFDGWPANRVSPQGAALARLPDAPALPQPAVALPVRAEPVRRAAPARRRPAPRRPSRVPSLEGTATPGAASVPPPTAAPPSTPAAPRLEPAPRPTAVPTPTPAATPGVLRSTAHEAAATVRDTGRELRIEPVTDPVAGVVDGVAGLLP